MGATSLARQQTKRSSLPLPLELTEPIILAASPLETLEALYDEANYHYNPLKQVREGAEGIPQIIMGGGSTCSGICGTVVGGVTISDRDTVKDD